MKLRVYTYSNLDRRADGHFKLYNSFVFKIKLDKKIIVKCSYANIFLTFLMNVKNLTFTSLFSLCVQFQILAIAY